MVSYRNFSVCHGPTSSLGTVGPDGPTFFFFLDFTTALRKQARIARDGQN